MRTAALPPRTEMLRAMLASDTSYEGVFFTAVKTTGIFCRPTCPARKPKPENVDFYATCDEALAAGFRPCKKCHPLNAAPLAPAWIRELLDQIETDPTRRYSDEDLAHQGLDPVQLRRWFQRHFGMTFHSYLRSRRLGLALGRLAAGDTIDDVALDHGYESLSGFREAFRKDFGTTPARARQSTPLLFTRLQTPLGPMLAAAEDRGVVMLEFLDRPILIDELNTLRDEYHYALAPGAHPHLQLLEAELAAYYAGTLRRFSVPLHLPGTAWERAVWALLLDIPFGETRSYLDLARLLAKPGASRAVGHANGRNRASIIVPCHRVVASNGALAGYGGGQHRKAFLLKHERASAQLALPS